MQSGDFDLPPPMVPSLESPQRTSDSHASPFAILLIAVTLFKCLLFPAYRSTDFEVHRNWLAITHSLPVKKWYLEATSQWTLDYPPLFAWMEFLLSFPARLFDRRMLSVSNLDYSSKPTILFQRLSVVLLDGVFAYATYQGYKHLSQRSIGSKSRNLYTPSVIYACLMLWNVGLLIVDHIHFQYNGFLFGFLQLAVIRIIEKRYLSGALWFSIALNFKHIFLYMAPPFGIFLFRQCCLPEGIPLNRFSLKKFLRLGGIFTGVTMVSFGPFLLFGQLGQVLSRLFPFQRGLTHAYWAPNFWALYNTVDKIASIAAPRLGLMQIPLNSSASLTGGLVGEQEHAVLPDISPLCTMILTVLGMIPALWSLWKARIGEQFVRGLVVSTLSSFLFGWHVHEKAILLATVPYTWLAINNSKDARYFLLLITAGYYGLHPLLFTGPEIPLKYMLLVLYLYAAFRMLRDRFPAMINRCFALPLLNLWESIYVLGFFAIEFYNCFLHKWIFRFDTKLPFLPLMFTSAYSSIGIIYIYCRLLISLF